MKRILKALIWFYKKSHIPIYAEIVQVYAIVLRLRNGGD